MTTQRGEFTGRRGAESPGKRGAGSGKGQGSWYLLYHVCAEHSRKLEKQKLGEKLEI
jgi:hypothetical protein